MTGFSPHLPLSWGGELFNAAVRRLDQYAFIRADALSEQPQTECHIDISIRPMMITFDVILMRSVFFGGRIRCGRNHIG